MAIDTETERMMNNWALWRSGSMTGCAVSGAYELEARGRHGDTPMPLINGEAVEIDQAVQLLDYTQRSAVEEFWLRTGPVVDKARRCGCAVAALYRRLERAHQAIRAHRQQLLERAQRIRDAYAHSHSENRKQGQKNHVASRYPVV